MYYMEIKGKKHKYSSLDAAVDAANQVFEQTGIILGIYHY